VTATELLDGLKARGATVAANGDRLKLTAPPGVLQPQVLAAIRDHKPELLALLQSGAAASTPSAHPPALVAFLAAVAAAAHPSVPGLLVVMSKDLCKLWRAAESEASYPLTLAGQPRRKKLGLSLDIWQGNGQTEMYD